MRLSVRSGWRIDHYSWRWDGAWEQKPDGVRSGGNDVETGTSVFSREFCREGPLKSREPEGKMESKGFFSVVPSGYPLPVVPQGEEAGSSAHGEGT